MSMETDNDEIGQDEGGAAQPDLLKSYVAYGIRAIRRRRVLAIVLGVAGVVLTVIAVAVWPRTFHCEMKLMAQRSSVLSTDVNTNPLSNASDVIGRHENLLAVVKQTELARRWEQHRPPILKAKDAVMETVRGKPSEDDMVNVLANYAGTRLWASVAENTLTIGADWQDGETAARLVEAAHQIFMESRHAAEISTIQEKIAILDGHAAKAKEEIDRLAEQLQRLGEERLAEAGKAVREVDVPGVSSGAVAVAPRRSVRAAEPDESLPALKEELETKKRTITELEGDRNRRLLEAQAKVAELQLRFTPSHPSARAAEQTVAMLSQESPRVAALRTEVKSLEAMIKERTAASKPDVAGFGGGGPGRPSSGAQSGEALSSEIMKLLEGGSSIDPAVNTQLQGAVSKYAALRDALGNARVDLDTAQAAFNYRYKVIVPPEVPSKPSKPKIPVILGFGILGALLLALLVPVAAELRRGVIVERWQIYQIQLPILAELKYPPGSPD